MEYSSFLLVMLTFSLAFGSLVQTSHPLDNFDFVRRFRSMGREDRSLDSSTSEEVFHSQSSMDGSGHSADGLLSQPLIAREPGRVSHRSYSGSGITSTTRPALTLHHSEADGQEADKANASITGHTGAGVRIISKEAYLEGSHLSTEELSHRPKVNNDFLTGINSPKLPLEFNVISSTTNQNPSGPRDPCVLGVRPCVVHKNLNGTILLWEDMRRTLTFAWELHVFGSASLFTLMMVLALIGMFGACAVPLPHPLCDALILANSFLIMGGSLRTILLLFDPYGTRQILSHTTLAALHNVPLSLLLWAQVILALITLRGLKLFFLPLNLERPWVVGGLAISHCTALFVTDLYSSTLSPTLPLWLQSLSICWGFPFCLGILTKSLSHLHPSLRSSVPHWVPSQRTERHGKRVIAVCAFLGVLCCSLQMYSVFWLYGLLGNWRRFSWGWWLSQFWARILELAWGFSLLVLGSWVFWTPSRAHSKGDHTQSRAEELSVCGRILASLRKPMRKPEKTWEDLMPNNWVKYNLSKSGSNVMSPYDNHPSSTVHEYTKPHPVSSATADPQAALMWHKIGERECVLSLIELDLRPPSPINLRHSIDNALYHGNLVTAGLFTPPPPSWTQGTCTAEGDNGLRGVPPAYVRYGWMLDNESISPSLDHFQARDSEQFLGEYDSNNGSPVNPYYGEDYDWSDDNITDL